MKRIITLLIAICLYNVATFAQKKYEMVVEKTGGTETAFNVEDVKRTYFRERNDGSGSSQDNDEGGTSQNINLIGTWCYGESEEDALGDLKNIEGWTFRSNGTCKYFVIYQGNYVENKECTYTDTNGEICIFYNNGTKKNYYTIHGNSMIWKGDIDITLYTRENFIVDFGGGGENGLISCPDGNHPHYIDLGLPSRTKWCCCNVGASSPEQYGSFLNFDEAYAYNPPSQNQAKELLYNTTRVWTTLNGVNGCKFIGPNGAVVFFPAAGARVDGEISWVGYYGFYWTRTNWDGYLSWCIDFRSDEAGCRETRNRWDGYTVRPVGKN